MTMSTYGYNIVSFTYIYIQLFYFSCVSSTDCIEHLKLRNGTIESPNYKDNRIAGNVHKYCIWEISVPEQSVIILNLENLNSLTYGHEENRCSYYNVEFVSVNIERNKIFPEREYGPYCEAVLPKTIAAIGMIFRVKFFWWKMNWYVKFKATYSIETYKCSTDNGGCQHICRYTLEQGYTCLCRAGYTLLDDGYNCKLNETYKCSTDNGGCQHICRYTLEQGYTCLCRAGYTLLDDGYNCKLNENLMKEINPPIIHARTTVTQWFQNIRNDSNGNERWGSNVARIAVALQMTDSNYFTRNNSMRNEIVYEVDNMILRNLLRDPIHPMSETELAVYIHALLVTCLDPRNFHKIDLVSKLRHRMTLRKNNTSPLAMLALCNADEDISDDDIAKTIDAFYQAQLPIWTSTQALALIALSCMVKRSETSNSTMLVINDMSSKLKERQNSDGSFENLPTTALVMQAIFSSETENGLWNPDGGVDFLVRSQMNDGSYGNFLNTYYTLPVLYHKSLLSISSSHCGHQLTNKIPFSEHSDEFDNKQKTQIWIKYSFWVGDHFDVIRSIIIHVNKNCTLFDVMKKAHSLDNTYRFKYFMSNSKPYVYSLSGYQDNPENEKFWFLYKRNNFGLNYEMINSSSADVVLKNKEEYVMWYRSGHWTQKNENLLKSEILLLDNENGSGINDTF